MATQQVSHKSQQTAWIQIPRETAGRRADKVAQPTKGLAVRPGDLSLILRTTVWKKRTDPPPPNCPLTATHYPPKVINRRNKIQEPHSAAWFSPGLQDVHSPIPALEEKKIKVEKTRNRERILFF